jgi:membrane protease YdiL (CAAX protease family)
VDGPRRVGEGGFQGLLAFALPFYGVVAAFAAGYALFSRQIGRLFGEAAPTPAGLLVGLALGLLLVVVSRVGAKAWRPMTRLRDALAGVVGALPLSHAVLLGLVSGAAEELLFRGALWIHLGLWGTTFLFGLLHVLPRPWLWAYPVFATAAGLLFGLLREGTESVWPAVLAHATVNVANLVWLARLGRAPAPPPDATAPGA